MSDINAYIAFGYALSGELYDDDQRLLKIEEACAGSFRDKEDDEPWDVYYTNKRQWELENLPFELLYYGGYDWTERFIAVRKSVKGNRVCTHFESLGDDFNQSIALENFTEEIAALNKLINDNQIPTTAFGWHILISET